MTIESHSPQTTAALPAQPISEEVLLEKYAKGDERSIDDVRQRVARALAEAERPDVRADWQARFAQALSDGFIPAGRIHSAAGTQLSATLINCFVQPVGDAIYSVQRTVSDKNVTADPLIYDGQRLIPSVTRVFSKQRDMFVFLQAYERGATATEPLVAFVTFYKGDAKALETAPLPVVDGLDARSKAVPLRFSVPLGGLEAGRYDCQVTVLDPASQKAAFWRATVVLVP